MILWSSALTVGLALISLCLSASQPSVGPPLVGVLDLASCCPALFSDARPMAGTGVLWASFLTPLMFYSWWWDTFIKKNKKKEVLHYLLKGVSLKLCKTSSLVLLQVELYAYRLSTLILKSSQGLSTSGCASVTAIVWKDNTSWPWCITRGSAVSITLLVSLLFIFWPVPGDCGRSRRVAHCHLGVWQRLCHAH